MNHPLTRPPQATLYAARRPRLLPRLMILVAAVLLLTAFSAAVSTKRAEASTPTKPTIVLVHGAWTGPSG
jgi:hypothetical protein